MSSALRTVAALAIICAPSVGCTWLEPQVRVFNELDGGIVRNVVYRGAVFPAALGPGEWTAVAPCVPGESPAFYQLATTADGGVTWGARQTVRTYRVEGVDLVEIHLANDNDTRDVNAPGPYGH